MPMKPGAVKVLKILDVFLFPGLIMNEIDVKVCDEVGSGTEGNVSLSFRTSFNDTSGSVYDNCTTNTLDKSSVENWKTGRLEAWDGKYFGSCLKSRWDAFRPNKDLEVKVHVKDLFLGIEHLQICKIRVALAFPYSTGSGSSFWRWTGAQWIESKDSLGTWLPMWRVSKNGTKI